jgi:hypothetical protein
VDSPVRERLDEGVDVPHQEHGRDPLRVRGIDGRRRVDLAELLHDGIAVDVVRPEEHPADVVLRDALLVVRAGGVVAVDALDHPQAERPLVEGDGVVRLRHPDEQVYERLPGESRDPVAAPVGP